MMPSRTSCCVEPSPSRLCYVKENQIKHTTNVVTPLILYSWVEINTSKKNIQAKFLTILPSYKLWTDKPSLYIRDLYRHTSCGLTNLLYTSEICTFCIRPRTVLSYKLLADKPLYICSLPSYKLWTDKPYLYIRDLFTQFVYWPVTGIHDTFARHRVACENPALMLWYNMINSQHLPKMRRTTTDQFSQLLSKPSNWSITEYMWNIVNRNAPVTFPVLPFYWQRVDNCAVLEPGARTRENAAWQHTGKQWGLLLK